MPPTSEPLPENKFPDANLREAYECCLSLERTAFEKEHATTTNLSPLVSARALGYGLVYAPSEQSCHALKHEILGCNSDPELLAELAHLYVYGLMRVFYNPKGPTPPVTATQTPRDPLALVSPDLQHVLDTRAQPLRQLILHRDDHRCVFTGILDSAYRLSQINASSQSQTRTPLETWNLKTRVAHIVSQSLSSNVDVPPETRSKFEWAKTAGAVLQHFGGLSSFEVLGDEILDNPANALTLSYDVHDEFDALDLWLMPVAGQENTYDIEHFMGDEFRASMVFGRVKPRVTFSDCHSGGRTIPAPDSHLIALHATCARVAHMSGAILYLKEYFRDTEVIPTMTAPGAVPELTRVLQKLQYLTSDTPHL